MFMDPGTCPTACVILGDTVSLGSSGPEQDPGLKKPHDYSSQVAGKGEVNIGHTFVHSTHTHLKMPTGVLQVHFSRFTN